MIKSWTNSVSYAYWYNLEIVPIVSTIDYLGCDCCWFVICLLIWYYLMLIFTATALFWKKWDRLTELLSEWVKMLLLERLSPLKKHVPRNEKIDIGLKIVDFKAIFFTLYILHKSQRHLCVVFRGDSLSGSDESTHSLTHSLCRVTILKKKTMSN